MGLIVQKYGGTSVADLDCIRRVATTIGRTRAQGHRVVAVVSAMAGETNRLVSLGEAASSEGLAREQDVLVSTGEQVTAALTAMVLEADGVPARSFLGSQIPIETDAAHGRARITRIETASIEAALAGGQVAVVAGFQGVGQDGAITTLGRGGSDTTAVALAAAMNADACEIYTDVDGVFTSDPRLVPGAHKLDRISHDEMLELAGLGAKILHTRSVAFAKRYGVPLHVRSSFHEGEGTWVVKEESSMEEIMVAGVACDRNQAKLTLERVPDKPGVAAKLFGPIAAAGIVVDMIIQNASADGTTDLTFTVPQSDYERARKMVDRIRDEVGAAEVRSDLNVAKVSIVGLGMRTHAGVAARTFEVLAAEGINVQMISTSEIKISVVVNAKDSERAVRALHDTFIERSS